MALKNTTSVYILARKEELYSHPGWWRLKECWFHSVMIPAFLSALAFDLNKQLLFPALITLATPLLPIMKIAAYIFGVMIGLIGELYEELFYIILRWKFYKTEYKPPWNPIILHFGTHHQFTPPMPHHLMVLSGVQLLQSFVGWLRKMIGQPMTFSNKLHRMGLHKLMLITLLSAQCISSTTATIHSMGNTISEQCKVASKLLETEGTSGTGEKGHLFESITNFEEVEKVAQTHTHCAKRNKSTTHTQANNFKNTKQTWRFATANGRLAGA